MSVTIDGWTISNAKAQEVRDTIADFQGLDVDDVDVAYVRTWMANHVRQLVMDRRRRIAAAAAVVDEADVMN